MNVVAGNYVEKLTKNVDDNDSMEYEESYEHRVCDDNLMEDDSQEQRAHHMHEQDEHAQYKTDKIKKEQ